MIATANDFRLALQSLRNLEYTDMLAAGIPADAINMTAPERMYLQLSPRHQEALWALVMKRYARNVEVRNAA